MTGPLVEATVTPLGGGHDLVLESHKVVRSCVFIEVLHVGI